MAQESVAATWPSVALFGNIKRESRHETILQVQWALAIACAYLVLFSEQSGGTSVAGPLVIVAFLLSNLVIGRLGPAVIDAPLFGLAIAIVDALLISASLYVAGQLSMELVMLCLAILILAIAGLRIGPIAVATLGITAAYLLIVWFTSKESLWQSSILLRVPLLFTAAIVYAWLVEVGSRGRSAAAVQRPARTVGDLSVELAAQLDAINRCQAAVLGGSDGQAKAALADIAAQNAAMQAKLAPQG